MSLRTFVHGTVMWMPLAGRIESGCVPSSSARTSSDHTPAALRTDRARRSKRGGAGVGRRGVVVQVGRGEALAGQRRHVGHRGVALQALVELPDPGAAREVV